MKSMTPIASRTLISERPQYKKPNIEKFFNIDGYFSSLKEPNQTVEQVSEKIMDILEKVNFGRDENLSPEEIKIFLEYGTFRLIKNVAAHATLTHEQIEQIIEYGNKKLLKALTENFFLPESICGKLFYSAEYIQVRMLANPVTTSDILYEYTTRMFTDQNFWRTHEHNRVAKHPNVTQEILHILLALKTTPEVKSNVLKSFQRFQPYKDWPEEWVEAHFGYKIIKETT